MDPSSFSMLLVVSIVGVAAFTATAWWDRIPVLQPVVVPSPRDHEPHFLTMMGPDGRPNPMSYERFTDYPGALKRQRELARKGTDSLVFHAETGEMRIDLAAWLGPYGRMSL